MKLTFVGTGEACDADRRNTSLLIEHQGCMHLLDCGFTTTSGYLQLAGARPVSTVWISHFHGDHFLGLPQLIVFSHMTQRTEPLTILSGDECREKILSCIELAYPGLPAKLPFPLRFEKLREESDFHHQGLVWRAAPVNHSLPAHGLRVGGSGRFLYYSGDGRPTAAALELMKGCDLVVHEAFSRLPAKPSHASIAECIEIAGRLDLPKLALVHINRETRLELSRTGKTIPPLSKTVVLIPDDGDTLSLHPSPS